MSHRRKRKERKKRKEKSDVDKTIKDFSDYYNAIRALLFQMGAVLKERLDAERFNVGEMKDCAPLLGFRCRMCKSDEVAIFIYENAVALGCLKCTRVEIVGQPVVEVGKDGKVSEVRGKR